MAYDSEEDKQKIAAALAGSGLQVPGAQPPAPQPGQPLIPVPGDDAPPPDPFAGRPGQAPRQNVLVPPGAQPPAQPQAAPQGDQSLSALQSALGPGAQSPAALSAPQTVQAPQPDMSKAFVPPGMAGGAQQVGAAVSPKPTVVPESWVNTMDPRSREELAAGQQRQLTGVDTESDAQRAAAREMADVKQGAADKLGDFDKQAADFQEQQKGLMSHLQEVQAQQYALRQEKVDPNHFYKEKSTGQRIGLVLAQVLGGFGAAMTHTENGPAKMIESAIDADVKAQQENLANKREGIGDELNLVGHKSALLGDLQKGAAAAKQQHMVNVAAQIDAITAKYQDPVIAARGEQLKGELMQKAAMIGKEINKYVPASVVGGAGGAGTIKVPIGEQGQLIRLPDGRTAHLGDAVMAKTVKEMESRTEVVHDLAKQVIALDQDREAHIPGTSKYMQLKQLRTDLAQTLTVQHEAAKGIGAIRGEEAAISGREVTGARGALANEGLWGHALGVLAPGRTKAAVDSAVRTADNLQNATLRSAGPALRIVRNARPSANGKEIEYDLTGETYQPPAVGAQGAMPWQSQVKR